MLPKIRLRVFREYRRVGDVASIICVAGGLKISIPSRSCFSPHLRRRYGQVPMSE